MHSLILFFTCCGPCSRSNVDAYALPHLIKCYNTIFDGVDETSATTRFEKFASCHFNGDLFGSSATRSDCSSFVLARWCKLGGLIDTSGSDLGPGVVDYFFKQNIKVGNQYVKCILAAIQWFQSHPDRHSIGAPVEVWCKDLFKLEGTFIPVQRIYGKFIPAVDIVRDENVLVVCPLVRKLQS